MSLLPIYINDEKIECLLPRNYGNYKNIIFDNGDNDLPAFVTEAFQGLPFTITDIQVCEVNVDNLSLGVLEVTPILSVATTELDINEIKQGIYTISHNENFTLAIQKCGVYQVRITLSDLRVFYSDIFKLSGVPTGAILAEQWAIINAESLYYLEQEDSAEPIKVSEMETTETKDLSYIYIIIPDGSGGYSSKKILATNIGGTDFNAFNDTPIVPIGTTATIDWLDGYYQVLDLGSAIGDVTLTFVNPKAGYVHTIEVIQGAIPRKIIYPSDVIWSDGDALSPSTSEDDIDIITMQYNNINYLATYATKFK